MSYQKDDLIKYRLEKSATTFNEAKSLAESGLASIAFTAFIASTALIEGDPSASAFE